MGNTLGLDCTPRKRLLPLEVKHGRERGCTDLIWLGLFGATWGAFILLIMRAIELGGDPKNLLNGHDMDGNTCGVDFDVRDKPLVAWPDPSYYEYRICVASCDETNSTDTQRMVLRYSSVQYQFYCVPEFKPEMEEEKIEISEQHFTNTTHNETIDAAAVADTDDWRDDGAVLMSDNWNGGSQLFSRALVDVYYSWPLLLGSGVFALVTSALLSQLLLHKPAAFIFLSCTVVFGGGTIAGWILMVWGRDAKASVSPFRIKASYASGIALWLASTVFILLVFAARNKIFRAIRAVQFVRPVSKQLPGTLFATLVYFVILLAYFAFWFSMAFYMLSVVKKEEASTPAGLLRYDPIYFPSQEQGLIGNSTFGKPNGNPEEVLTVSADSEWKTTMIFNFFHLIWSVEFLLCFQYMTLAGSIAAWYFSPFDPSTGQKKTTSAPKLKNRLGPLTTFYAFFRIFKHNAGTAAAGGLFILPAQMIRTLVHSLEKSCSPSNPLSRCVMCCIGCCVRFVESPCGQVSHDALVFSALYSRSLFAASVSSFDLLWQNLPRIAAIHSTPAHLFFVFKIAISLVTTGASGACLISESLPFAAQVASPVIPMLGIFIMSYLLTTVFVALPECLLSTMLVCYLADVAAVEQGATSHSQNELLASPELQEYLADYTKQSVALALQAQHVRSRRLCVNQEKVRSMMVPHETDQGTLLFPSPPSPSHPFPKNKKPKDQISFPSHFSYAAGGNLSGKRLDPSTNQRGAKARDVEGQGYFAKEAVGERQFQKVKASTPTPSNHVVRFHH